MTIPIDKLIRTRRKTLALIVERDGTLTVRAPLKLEQERIEAFIAEKDAWIRKKKLIASKLPPIAKAKKYVEGEEFLYLGKSYLLVLVSRQEEPLLLEKEQFSLKKSRVRSGKALFTAWYKARALEVITERAEGYAHRHGFKYSSVKIGSARTRWGSCSGKDSLNFTWRLILAPEEIVDYVIIHELAHTRQKNHSPKFWAEVEALDPHYKEHRRWLKRNGGLLGL